MTEIDFYILPHSSQPNRQLFICRLVEKIHQLGQRIFIHCDSAEQQQSLDDQLWTFKAESFIPHEATNPSTYELGHESAHQPPSGTTESVESPVVMVWIGYDFEPSGEQPVLINLSGRVPPFFSRFERVLEVVNQEPTIQQQGREKYRFYQQRGYLLRHHKL